MISSPLYSQTETNDSMMLSHAPIPFQLGGQIPIHRFATQAEFLLGTATIIKGDKPRASFTGTVKGIYQLTGNVYVSTGVGVALMRSESRAQVLPDMQLDRLREALVISLPSGIGFSMGDDRAGFISGIDLLPSVYVRTPAEIRDPRRLAIGFAPEFGWMFKAGRRDQKGILIGMLGRVNFLQPASKSGGSIFQYVSSGAGLVVKFY